MMRIGFVGGGKMASAILSSLLKNGCDPSNLTVSDSSEEARARHAAAGVCVTADNAEAFLRSDLVFLAVKPQHMTEALAGIDLYTQTGNAENLCEKLGDVLMQVVLLSQIAREKGLFDITDVIKGISEKMIRRHPHVFGAPGTEVPDWEAIKQQEKQQRSRELEQAEKAAFRAAAGQIICHLSER